ncbi:MAG: flagella basal body P-ring formation protein FlgA [Deltaproteobacteria bacterium]|nr:flagella basal body P-ring formation protein FlgA [Deltaproteobacteria bacterium]
MRSSAADLFPILVLAGACAPTPAEAVEPSVAIGAAVAERLGIGAADVEVGKVDISGPGDLDWTVELPRYGTVTGRVPVTLSASSEGHPVRFRVTVPVDAWLSVPVAQSDTLPGHDLVLGTARVRATILGAEKPVDPALQWEASTTLARGQPVTTLRARLAPSAREGASVTLMATRGAVTIRAPGRLEGDAFEGQPVAVTNLATKTMQSGTYRGGMVILGGS